MVLVLSTLSVEKYKLGERNKEKNYKHKQKKTSLKSKMVRMLKTLLLASAAGVALSDPTPLTFLRLGLLSQPVMVSLVQLAKNRICMKIATEPLRTAFRLISLTMAPKTVSNTS